MNVANLSSNMRVRLLDKNATLVCSEVWNECRGCSGTLGSCERVDDGIPGVYGV